MRVGVLGSGQLGKMLALSGIPLGMEFVFFGPDPSPCVEGLGTIIIADFSDNRALMEFVDLVDVVTAESEHIPMATLELVEQSSKLSPHSRAIGIAQDRLKEKQFIQDLGVPLPRFEAVSDAGSLQAFLAQTGGVVLKTRFHGYDGKGQIVLEQIDDIAPALEELGNANLIAEQRVDFGREISQLAVRDRHGAIRFYPLTENLHQAGILRTATAVANDRLEAEAQEGARRIMQALDYVGVLCVEYFDVSGSLLVNEIAPRVHNSGHWTIEGATTSQFENHVRAILDLPLGSTQQRGHSVMVNLIGTIPDEKSLLSIDGAHLHVYGKAPREGRKLGHVTLCHEDRDAMHLSLRNINAIIA